MNATTLWLIIAGVLVGMELLTGTFYLLMLAVGAAGAGLAAWLGASHALQLLVAAIMGGGAAYVWRRKHRENDLNLDSLQSLYLDSVLYTGPGGLDVGEKVQVLEWTADGTARVTYRGSGWTARFHGRGVPRPGLHRIKSIESNQLVLERP